MPFTLKQLRYFVAVAEAGGITPASQILRIAQPSLSAAIAQLEADFGVQLFLRHRARGLSLTPPGRRFLGEARRFLQHAEEVEVSARDLSNSMTGVLQIGCFLTLAPIFLPRLLFEFARGHPATRVEFSEGALDELQDGLLAGICEVALLYDLDLSDRLETHPLAEVSPYVLLAEGHPLAKRKRIDLAQLAKEPMVLLDLPHSREYFRSIFLSAGCEPTIRHRTRDVEVVRGLVANGDCFSLLNLPALAERAYDGRRLTGLPLAQRVPPAQIVLAKAKGARLSRRADTFAKFCQAFFSQAVFAKPRKARQAAE